MKKLGMPLNTKESGQSLVELALTFTLLLLMLAGTVDLGRGFFTWVALRDAAQEGAAYGSIDPTEQEEDIETRVYDILLMSRAIPDPQANVTVTHQTTGPACLGSTIQVTVEYSTFPISMPFLSTAIGRDTLLIRATVRDTILRPTCGTP